MAPRAARRPLGQILLNAGTISAAALEAALARAQKTQERIGEALIAMRRDPPRGPGRAGAPV